MPPSSMSMSSGRSPEKTASRSISQGAFAANPNTFFFQRTIGHGPLFEPASVDTAVSDVVSSGSEDEAMEIVEVKGQKIAGRDARCFELRRKEDTGEGKSDVQALFCVDKQEGIPLLFEGKGTSEGAINTGEVLGEDSVDTGSLPEKTAIDGAIKAKSVAFKASDADFKPPYKIVESID